MKKLKEKYQNIPTIMDYADQLKIMKELAESDLCDIQGDMDGFLFIIDKLQDSHQDNGVFEYKKKDQDIFLNFSNFLESINKNYNNPHIRNLIETFKDPGFGGFNDEVQQR